MEKYLQIYSTVTDLGNTEERDFINHHHMKHGNWWCSQMPEGPQPHNSHRTWQHTVDHSVPIHSTFIHAKVESINH
jgi:hypothetical protein